MPHSRPLSPLSLIVSEPDFASRLYIIAPLDLSNALVSRLLSWGVVEVAVVKKGELLEKGEPLVARLESYVRLVERAETLASKLAEHIEGRHEIELAGEISPEESPLILENLVEKLERVLAEIESLAQASKSLEKRLLEAEMLRALSLKLLEERGSGDSSLLSYEGEVYSTIVFYGDAGAVREVSSRALEVLAYVEFEKQAVASLLFYTKTARSLELPEGAKTLELAREAPRRSLGEVAEWARAEALRARRELEEVLETKRRVVRENIRDYASLLAILQAESSRATLLKNALSSRMLAIVSGLVPSSLCPDLGGSLRDLPVYSFCEPEEDPPAELRNLRIFKPFESITRLVGAPSTKDWDPTPILTYAFAIFFGLMVGDAGYGLLLLALSPLLPKLAPKLGLDVDVGEKARPVMALCGASSTIAGLFVFGSFFGDLLYASLGLSLPKLADPIADISDLIVYSIVFGWAWLIASYALGLVRALVKLRSALDIISSASMIALLLAGPHVVSSLLFERPLAHSQLEVLVYAVFVTGLVGLIASKVSVFGALGLFLWVFDLSGLVSETLSFMRIAALAFGSSLLANLVNDAALAVASVSPLASIPILVGGHALGLVLATIAAFAHTLRLCVYEVSTKFYTGGNRFLEYARFRIPTRVVVEAKRRV
ncbi:MAG: hypothetical protein QXS85_01915 [Acidilobaceae archaeon]